MTSAENVELRRKLEEMTEGGTEPSKHRALLSAISVDCPNTIRSLESRLPEHQYTCGMYVFSFYEYDDIAGLYRHVFAGPAFFEWLLSNHLLQEIEEAVAQDDDLIMYFDSGKWKHVGFCRKDRVESKWGLGLLYEHRQWEVPKHYG